MATSNTPETVKYGTWADRSTNPQTLWNKRVPGNEPEVLAAVSQMFSAGSPISVNLSKTESALKSAQSLLNSGEHVPVRNSQISLDVYRAVKHKYENLFTATAGGINSNNINVLPAGSKYKPGQAQSPAALFNEAFQPLSTFIGTTMVTMPNILGSPMGNSGPCAHVGAALERINPRFKQDMMSVHSALKLEQLSHLPSQIMGSVRHLSSAVNNLLSGPAHLIHDLYSGAISAIQKMSAMVNSVFNSLSALAQKAIGFATGMISGLAKAALGSLMGAVGGLMSKLTSLTGAFSGMSMLTNFTSSLTNKLSSGILGGINLKNPFDVNKLFQNPALGLARGFSFNDPGASLQKLIPPGIAGNLSKVAGRASSFGMGGNAGHSLVSNLASVKSGALAGIISNFSSQAGILSHIFTGHEPTPASFITGSKLAFGPENTKYNIDSSHNVVKTNEPRLILNLNS